MVIENVHPEVSKFIGLRKIVDPEIMYNEVKVFFKKCFGKKEISKRFLDSALSADPDKSFFLFFASSIILLFYVPLMIKNGGGVFDFSNDHYFYEHFDLQKIIDVAREIPKNLANTKIKNIIFEKFKDEKCFMDYKPVYLEISDE